VINTEPEHEEGAKESDGKARVDNINKGGVYEEDEREKWVIVKNNSC
jgi:hypothetical protein